MRVAVIVVSMLVISTSSYASDSCLTKDEARKHFATSYLYWHGSGHCWDAHSGRLRSESNIRQKSKEEVRKEGSEPNWREAHSQVLSPNATLSAPQSQPSKGHEATRETSEGAALSQRWVDIAQVVPSFDAQDRDHPELAVGASARSSGPSIAAGGIILIFLGSIVVIAVIEFLRRSANRPA